MGLFDNVTDEWMATEVFAEKLRQVREYAMAFLSAMSRLPEALEQFLSTCLSPYTRYLLKNSQFAFELLHALTRHLDTDDIRWICKNATRDEFSEIASSPELNNLLEQTFASWGTSALPEETKRGALKTICLLTWPDLPRPYFPPNFLAGKVGSALLTRLFKSCEVCYLHTCVCVRACVGAIRVSCQWLLGFHNHSFSVRTGEGNGHG
jgi:hypothetical protein